MSDARDIISALASARKAVQLYPPSHPAHDEALDALVSAVERLVVAGPLSLNLYQGRLYHDSTVLPEDALGAAAVAEALDTRRVESLTFQPGFGRNDALALTQILGLRPSPDLDVAAELAARGVTAVAVAVLAAPDDDERKARDEQRAADRAMYQQAMAALRRIQQRLASGGADISEASPLVTSVMERLFADLPAMLGAATIRSAGERDLTHSLNVMIYSLALGHRLGLPQDGLEALGLCALLHDVGKAAFDADDPSQAEAMRLMHPETGAEILQRVALENPAPMLVAYEHHMTADGGGWPKRAADYVAHPYSRMVAIANRYDNLTNPGNGVTALTPDRAVITVVREGGAGLDPFFTRLFANALGAFPVGCLVRLSNHSVGVVARQGEDPLAPVVKLSYDARGMDVDDPVEIDLAEDSVRIVEVIEPSALAVEVSDRL